MSGGPFVPTSRYLRSNLCPSGAFSGLLAYGISFMSGTRGCLGWSWTLARLLTHSRFTCFNSPSCLSQILEGRATVGVGILAYLAAVARVSFPSGRKLMSGLIRSLREWWWWVSSGRPSSWLRKKRASLSRLKVRNVYHFDQPHDQKLFHQQRVR